MKKIFSVFLAVLMVCLLLASCGKSTDTGAQQTQQAGQSEAQDESKPEKEVLSDDYHSGQIQIDGVIYTLPVKGSEFLSNGWNVVNDYDKGITIDPDDDEEITLSNGSTEADIDFYNYAGQAVTIENCYVSEIYIIADDDEQKGSVILPGNLNVSTAKYQDFESKWNKSGAPSWDGIADGNGDTIVHYIIADLEDDYKYVFKFNDDYSLHSVSLINENRPAVIDVDENAEAASQADTSAQTEPESLPAVNVTNLVNVDALSAI